METINNEDSGLVARTKINNNFTLATLNNGSGTTANGSAVDLGGELTKTTALSSNFPIVIQVPIFQLFDPGGNVVITLDATGFYLNGVKLVTEDRTINGLTLSSNISLPIIVQRTGDANNYITNTPNASPTSTSSFANNSIKAFPFIITKSMTATEIVSEITSLSAGTTYRVGLYTDNNGYPNTLVANSDVGTYDSGTLGVRTGVFAAPITLSAGLYWIVVNSNGLAGFRANTQANNIVISGLPAMGSGMARTSWSATLAYGALPSTFPAGAGTTNATLSIIIGIKTN